MAIFNGPKIHITKDVPFEVVPRATGQGFDISFGGEWLYLDEDSAINLGDVLLRRLAK